MELKGYTNIPDWMLSLGLDIWETMIYAIIFSFSQDGDSSFKGSWSYLAKKCMCSRAKVAKSLTKLVDMGLIKKMVRDINGVRFCEYSAAETGSICERQVVSVKDEGSTAETGSICERHNNIDINNKDNNISIPYNSLPYHSERFAELWSMLLEQPKWKKKSKAALKLSLKKLAEQPEEVACQMMEDTIANGWQGLFLPKVAAPARPKESVYSHNLKLMQDIMGGQDNE